MDLSIFSENSLFSSKGRSSIIFWTSLGKPDDCSHESLRIMTPVAREREDVSTVSTAGPHWQSVTFHLAAPGIAAGNLAATCP